MSSPASPHAPLADGWSLWRPFALRGAGFPFASMLSLAAPGITQACEALCQAQEARREAALALLAALQADPAITKGSAGQRKRWRKWRSYLQRGETPHGSMDVPPAAEAFVDALSAASDAEAQAQQELDQTWDHEQRSLRSHIQDEAQDPMLRRAISWQNPKVLATSLDGLATLSLESANRSARQARLLAVRYLQRYCTKNDTIGFFGPVGWGSWEQGDALLVRPGLPAISARTVSFEPWAMDAFAKAWGQQPAALWDHPPRLHPLLDLQGDRIYGTPGTRSRDQSRTLQPQERALLARCDGRRTPREIIAALLTADDETNAPLFADQAAVVSLLLSLVQRGWLLWELEIPFGSRPEDALLAYLKGLQDEILQAQYQAQLQPVLDAKAALEVAAEAESPKALEAGMQALRQAFVQSTGVAAQRNEGKTYAGRGLVFMDCRRALELQLPQAWLDAISAPLSLILESARWFSYEIASRYRQELVARYEAIARRMRQAEVPLVALWRAAKDWLDPLCPAPVAAVVAELQTRWAQLIPLGPHTTQPALRVESAAIRDQAQALFAAPHPGWPGARHHAPDLLLAARDVDALQAGEYEVILGELHAGLNPLSTLTMTSQHPDLAALQALYRGDIPQPGIAPIPAVDFARSAHDSRLAPEDFHLDTGAPWASWRPPGQRLTMGALWVTRAGESLQVATRDKAHIFDIIEIIERRLKTRAAVHFAPLASDAPHTPRVMLDRLVVAREAWRVAADALTFAHAATPKERFLGAHRWGQAMGLPRFLFAKAPHEVKPIYIDRESPHSIEIFCHLIGQHSASEATAAQPLGLTEMLPSPAQLWLPDTADNRYTCELRTIAVDPIAWRREETEHP